MTYGQKRQWTFNCDKAGIFASYSSQFGDLHLWDRRDNQGKRPRFKEQNFESCVLYYKEIFEDMEKKYTKEQLNPLFATVLVEQAQSMQGIVPEWTIYEFIDLLREASNK